MSENIIPEKETPVEEKDTQTLEFQAKDALYKVEEGVLVIGLGTERYSLATRKLTRRFLKRLKLNPKEWMKKPGPELTAAIGDAAANYNKTFVAEIEGDKIVSLRIKKEERKSGAEA